MRSASRVFTIAVARIKAPTMRYTGEAEKPSSAVRSGAVPVSTASGTTIRLAMASGIASVR